MSKLAMSQTVSFCYLDCLLHLQSSDLFKTVETEQLLSFNRYIEETNDLYLAWLVAESLFQYNNGSIIPTRLFLEQDPVKRAESLLKPAEKQLNELKKLETPFDKDGRHKLRMTTYMENVDRILDRDTAENCSEFADKVVNSSNEYNRMTIQNFKELYRQTYAKQSDYNDLDSVFKSLSDESARQLYNDTVADYRVFYNFYNEFNTRIDAQQFAETHLSMTVLHANRTKRSLGRYYQPLNQSLELENRLCQGYRDIVQRYQRETAYRYAFDLLFNEDSLSSFYRSNLISFNEQNDSIIIKSELIREGLLDIILTPFRMLSDLLSKFVLFVFRIFANLLRIISPVVEFVADNILAPIVRVTEPIRKIAYWGPFKYVNRVAFACALFGVLGDFRDLAQGLLSVLPGETGTVVANYIVPFLVPLAATGGLATFAFSIRMLPAVLMMFRMIPLIGAMGDLLNTVNNIENKNKRAQQALKSI